MKIALTTLASLFLLAGWLPAQQGDDLSSAVQKLNGQSLTCSCNISDSSVGDASAPLSNTSQNPLVPFQGNLSVFVDKDGSISAASTAMIPRVMIFQNGEKQLFNQMHSGQAVDAKAVAKLLRMTLNMQSLAMLIGRGEIESRLVEGGSKFRVALDGDQFGAEIKEVTLLANVDEDGNVAGLAFRFQHRVPIIAPEKSARPVDSGKQVIVKLVFDNSVNARAAKAFGAQAKRILK